MVTQQQLKELVNYDPLTGVFTRLKRTSNSTNIGDVVGTKTTHGYLLGNVGGVRKYMHQFAFLYMTGEIPKEIDHIDRNSLNNSWSNLRSCTRTQNNLNQRRSQGLRGIYKHSQYHRWTAEGQLNSKKYSLGTYVNFCDAVKARKEWECQYVN